MRLFGLIGFPLSHSFSKRYFDQKFEKENITGCKFENFSIPSISELPDLIKAYLYLTGLAITIPYKQTVLKYIDDSSNIPNGITACNCICVHNNKLIGYNTDYIGFKKSLQPLLLQHHQKALILGNGGATEAVAYALKELAIDYTIVSRNKPIGESAIISYSDLTEKIITAHTIIINTTPLGMYPAQNTFPDIPYQFLSTQHLLYDLTYNPSVTSFLNKGQQQGAIIKNGEEMLIIQAEENWKIWNL